MLRPRKRELPRARELLGVVDRPQESASLADELARLRGVDMCDHIEENFYIPAGGRMVMPPHQKIITRIAFTRRPNGRFAYTTIVYSTVKKSGKSTWSGAAGRAFTETQAPMGEIYAVGNDLKQAQERAFREIRRSIELTPGYDGGRKRLPGRWAVLEKSLRCLSNSAVIQALAVDARGEAGGAPALSIWTELWGVEYPAALRFWDEMTTVPTIPDSIRIVETYSGFEGESKLLWSIYERGKVEGRQLTNGEAARLACRDKDGERYEDFLDAWHDCWPFDCFSHPDVPRCSTSEDKLIPIWVDDRGLFMYWDEGVTARRMPWQRNERGVDYYEEQASSNRPNVFRQHHLNEWTGSESNFIPIEVWDACVDPTLPPLLPGDKTPIVIGVDAASAHDCFAIVAVSRYPSPERQMTDVAIRACRKWDPPAGEHIDYSGPEGFLRFLVQGGCAAGHPQYAPFRRTAADVAPDGPSPSQPMCGVCESIAQGSSDLLVPGFNVIQIAYDPYQLEDMMQRFRRESVSGLPNAIAVWCEEFPQKEPRAKADKRLYDMVIARRLVHNGDPDLREHIRNANAQTQKVEDSKLRIVKKREGGGKIDLVVAASMAVDRCLEKILA